jgi:hypothetical protein
MPLYDQATQESIQGHILSKTSHSFISHRLYLRSLDALP